MSLKIEEIFHRYPSRDNWVLQDVSLELEAGQITGLLGESGSGKSTLGQIAAGLLKPIKGNVLLDGKAFPVIPRKTPSRRRIQMLFQHPETSFNPRRTLEKSLTEVCKLCQKPSDFKSLCDRVLEFGIYPEQLKRHPAQLSGGELQRLAIVRALLADPEVLILDEPTSMLDVISQAQVMTMLMKLKEKQKIAYLFITHDIALCQYVSDRIYSIDQGKIQRTPGQEALSTAV